MSGLNCPLRVRSMSTLLSVIETVDSVQYSYMEAKRHVHFIGCFHCLGATNVVDHRGIHREGCPQGRELNWDSHC